MPYSTCAETDVDEGHDWDIFNINEGLGTQKFGFALLYNMSMPLKSFINQ